MGMEKIDRQTVNRKEIHRRNCNNNDDDDVDERPKKNNGFKSKAYIEWNSQTEQIKTIKRAEWWVHSTFVCYRHCHRQPSPDHSSIHTEHTHRKQNFKPMRKIIPHCHIAACGNVSSMNVWKSAMPYDWNGERESRRKLHVG